MGPLWAALGGIALVSTFGLADHTNTVGVVPGGLPTLAWPEIDLALWLALLPSAAVISATSAAESFSCRAAARASASVCLP